MGDIAAEARDLRDEMIRTRRELHRRPEIAFEEVETAALVAERLEAVGLQVRRQVGQTGVVGTLVGGRPGKTVLVRADMDALPIATQLSASYASEVPGAMHACGHDGHTAIALTVAKLLARRAEELAGTVLFVFQPAEEILAGARAMLDNGALDGVEVDATIGLHLINDLPVGTVHMRPGPTMAGIDAFRIVIEGRGGHAAKPHQNIDAIVAASHVVTALQTIVSRNMDPIAPTALSVTSIQGGDTYNVAPSDVELKGVLRSFDDEVEAMLRERVETVTQQVASALGAQATVEWAYSCPVVVNDPAITRLMREVAEDCVGPEHVRTADLRMSGEDMAHWLARNPGCYLFVGTRNEAKGFVAPHHNPSFDIDESALPIGVEVLTKGVLRALS